MLGSSGTNPPALDGATMNRIRALVCLGVVAGVLNAPAAVQARPATAAVVYGGAISRDRVLRRAADWLRRDVAYSQDNRNATWDPGRGRRYRPDCSGFVSMAWALDPRHAGLGRALVTWELPTVSTRVSWARLAPGDILLRLVPGDRGREHVVLFQGWVDRTKTRFWIVEENGRVYDMRRRVVTVRGVTPAFRPYRYDRIF